MTKKLSPLLALLTLGAISTTAQAGLIGDTVTIRYLGNNDTGAVSEVVGAGEEGNFFGNQFYDFGDSSFSIRSEGNYCGVFACSGQPISLLLGSLDFGAPLTNVAFATNLAGVSVSWGANFATFSWSEQSLTPGTYLTATFSTTSVPEPGTLALFGLALGAFGFGLRRKQAPRA
jgi:hypothetical protein